MAAASTSEEDVVNRFNGCTLGCFTLTRFVNDSEIKDHYICSVGHGVLNNPKIVPCCRNAICHHCIIRCTIPYNNEDNTFPQQERPSMDYILLRCPICRGEFEANKLTDVSLNFKNELDELRLRCSFKECNETDRLENIFSHEFRCPKNPEREDNCSDCNTKLRYSVLKDHFCKQKVLKKFEEVDAKAKQARQEAAKQKDMVKKLLE